MLEHGGDLSGAVARFGIPVADWLDLSTGINPVPYPVPALPAEVWTRLPQRDREADLLRAARTFYAADSDAGIVAAPGTQALLQWLPTLLPPGPVAIVGPTYGEHLAVWHAAGHDAREVPGLEHRGGARVCVIVNPNNPDGRLAARAALLDCAADLARRGGFLVVDEAFADAEPAASIAAAAGRPGLVVLRSFGKFFGLPGVRLGFALTDPETASALQGRLGPWAVSGPAIEIGRVALADQRWAAETREQLRVMAGHLDAVATGAGVQVVGGTTLFRLLRTEHANALYEHLGRAGILTRRFAYRSDWLRLGLPPDEQALARLATRLKSFRA